MKVAVITRHAVINYGSLLQALATQTAIERLGHTCEIIDYIRDDEHYSQREKTLLKRKPSWNKNFLKRMLYLAMRQPDSRAAGKQFEKEQGKLLHLTRRYTSPEELKADPPTADIYVTGSDQVWGPVENGSYDDTYCLSFTQESAKRISYAASIGRTDMTPAHSTYFQTWLSRYAHVAVREESAAKILQGLGIHAEQVLDPTLLLDRIDWEVYATPLKLPEKYVLVYQLHNDKKLSNYAKRVAKHKKLPLIRISASRHQSRRGGKFKWKPLVGEFLTYIKQAEVLITDSFHGTAFAINFNTPFVEVLPNNNTGTRNISILKMTGLSHRILKDENDIALADQPIDFTEVNQRIAEEREKSLDLLCAMLKSE